MIPRPSWDEGNCLLPHELALPKIADAICKDRCFQCRKLVTYSSLRNRIARDEYVRSGRCQSCQDMYIANPSRTSELIFGENGEAIGISFPYVTIYSQRFKERINV
jgi:hypothetical protein